MILQWLINLLFGRKVSDDRPTNDMSIEPAIVEEGTKEVKEIKDIVNKNPVIITMIERKYSLYSQKDERWAKVKIGNTNLLIKDYGCLITSIGMIFNTPPYQVNLLLKAKKGITNDGKVIWKAVEDIFSCSYTYLKKDPKRLCIAETNHYKNKGLPQHFFLWVGDGRIVDPLDIKPIEKKNNYNIVSWRLLEYV